MVTSTLTTITSKEADLPLKHMLYIYYSIYFKKNQAEIQALINFENKVNTMTPVYASKLGLKVLPTNIRAQKIDNSIVKTFGMVSASFYIDDKFRKP